MLLGMAWQSLSFWIDLLSLRELARETHLMLFVAKLAKIHLRGFLLPFLALTARCVVVAVSVTAGRRCSSVWL